MSFLLYAPDPLACSTPSWYFSFFFFNDTATTEIYTLSLHDALPISPASGGPRTAARPGSSSPGTSASSRRSEEHTSELQSPCNLVCRLLLEKKKSKSSQSPRRDKPPPGSRAADGSPRPATCFREVSA